MSSVESPDDGQQTLSIHRIDRRPLPEGIEDLSDQRRECWHCHNSASSMHILECRECEDLLKGPVVQDEPTCSCGGLRECIRYIRRPAGRGEDGYWQKTCHHPGTGEEASPEELRERGFR